MKPRNSLAARQRNRGTVKIAARLYSSLDESWGSGHALQRELADLETRQAELVRQAEALPPSSVIIHPNAAEIYRKKVADLHAARAEPETRGEAAEALRGLIEEIRVTPEGDGNTVELAGELAALLRLGGNKNAASVEEAARSGLLVAGRGFEPLTFRL